MKYFIFLAMGLMLLLLPLGVNEYVLHVVILILINVLLAISLRMTHLTGYLSFGQSAPAAIGAYTSALLVTKLGWPFLVALITAGLVALAIGTALGAITMRIRGTYFILTTMAYVEIIRLIIDLLEPWTKGVTGLTGIPPPSLFGVVLEGMIGKYYFFCILAATILLITFKLEKSSTGLIWQGIGLNSDLCESAGINTYMNKIAAFAVSSFIAGIVGSYYAHYMGVMFSTTFGWVWGANIAFYNFIGGTGSFFGPIVGAVFLTGISEPLRGVAEYEMFFFALAMVLVMIFLPGGIISLPKRIGSIIRKPSVDKTGI